MSARRLQLLAGAVLLAACLPAIAELRATPGTRVENLTPHLARAGAVLDTDTEFEVAAGNAWLLTADHRIVDLGSGKSVLPKGFAAHSFARTRQGAIAVVTDDVFGTVAQGLFLPTAKLPYGNMRVVPGPGESFLLFGGPEHDQALISFDGASYAPVLRVPEPIGEVTHIAERIFLAAGAALYTAKWGDAPSLAFVAPGGRRLAGVAVNPVSGEIYLSTADAIFALSNGVATERVNGIGGRLQYRDGALYVLDTARGQLLRLRFP